MEEFIIKEGKRLRLGYTTGSCAAAAAKAAAYMLLTGRRMERAALTTPRGVRLELPVREIWMEPGAVSCAVEKDSGDDPDVTRGTLVFAAVSRTEGTGVTIDGGAGVGRVTKPGLDQPVGAAAINSVPRRMIREGVEEIQALTDDHGGLSVVISVPEGEALAKKTFNPRLGIVGGISILGTTGIVEPMSERALVETIRVELRQRRAAGADYALLTPGNYGSDFIREGLGLDPALAVQCSNFLGDALDLCRELGFRGALLAGHIGKLVKVGGGMLNTHSRYGDCRMEILAAHAAASGLPPERTARVLACVSCDEALRILREADVDRTALARLTERIAFHLAARAGESLEVGAILFSKVWGELSRTGNAAQLLQQIVKGGT
ncbi:MAG: cobalamin biosynthesis protein CbiD [Oscillospiraceae bacterium]|jgi:cobalt-precorrin-5B (C1)-methyltransferase|nr:cobalamin biosynthesis protein CbiD [Oscillospiraceae bacterium]